MTRIGVLRSDGFVLVRQVKPGSSRLPRRSILKFWLDVDTPCFTLVPLSYSFYLYIGIYTGVIERDSAL